MIVLLIIGIVLLVLWLLGLSRLGFAWQFYLRSARNWAHPCDCLASHATSRAQVRGRLRVKLAPGGLLCKITDSFLICMNWLLPFSFSRPAFQVRSQPLRL